MNTESDRASNTGSVMMRVRDLLRRDRVLFPVAMIMVWIVAVIFKGRQGSGVEWNEIADNILAGKGYLYPFYGTDIPRQALFPPFYPGFLALMKTCGGSHWIALLQLVQSVVFAGGAVCVRRLAARLYGDKLSWFAGYLVIFWPPLLIYSARLSPSVFNAALIPALLLLLDRARQTGRLKYPLVAGAGWGLLAYSLPAFLSALPFLGLGLKRAGLTWRRALLLPTIVLLTALLTLSPWIIRNAVVLGDFVPVSSNIGLNLAGSNNPYASTSYNTLCEAGPRCAEIIDYDAIETVSEGEFDRQLLRYGLRYMVEHPGQTAVRCLTRAACYWSGNPTVIIYNFRDGLASIILMSLLLPLFITGLVVAIRKPAGEVRHLVFAVFIWATLFYMNFAVRGRYILDIQPLMLVFGVLGFATLFDRIATMGRSA
ncbi:MAG: hypothetical protein GY835_16155 [bacterium]|nr:hypothetical protein [bacterium]